MGSSHHLRFVAIPVAHALAPASMAAGVARRAKDEAFHEVPELKDWS